MKTKHIRQLLLACLLTLTMSLPVFAQGTAFTYQGKLNDGGAGANGIYDLRFLLSDALTGGAAVGQPLTNAAVVVSNGLFTVTLDFGTGVFTGPPRWLEIGVRTNASQAPHTILTPRQPLTATPYAIFAGGAQTASTVATGGVSAGALAVGAVDSSAIADGSIQTNDLSAPLLDGTFWRLNGNSGPGNFLGSTDNRPLELRVNNTPALRLVPTSSGANIIGGFSGNSVRTGIEGATISGGGVPDDPNLIEGGFSTIGGGWGNTNNGFNGFIGGGYWNRIEAGGLSFNNFIGAGAENAIGSNVFFGVVAGGRGNVISNQSQYPTIGGGRLNRAAGSFSTVGGGLRNTAEGGFSTLIAGGAVAGGSDNFAIGNTTFIGGGNHNTNTSLSAVIGGGERNTIFDVSDYATISGGRQNTIQTNSDYSVIGGGYQNVIHDLAGASAIAGGRQNSIQTNATYAFIGGGYLNAIQNDADNSAIAGGVGNRAGAGASFIGGGSYNTNTGGGAVIGGGIANRAENFDAVIAGGAANFNAGYRAFIGGGEGNAISNTGPYAVVGGGYGNRAQGNSATVGGGGINNASGLNATVPGGVFSDALGDYSFASGRRAKALHAGAFVWADSTDADFASSLNDQFSVRASGGVRLVTSGTGMTLDGQPVLSGTVSSAQLANGSVTAAKIPTGQVVKSLNSLMDNVTLTAGPNVTITPSGNTLQIAATFTGPVSDNQLSSDIARLNAPAAFTGSVTATHAANNFSGAFAGNGGGLTNLSAANLSGSVPGAALTSVPAGSLTGTIADARLSANVALLNANQTFTGNNSFSSALGLGTVNPAAKLHLYSTDNPTIFRIQSTGTPGFGRIEFVSNPQGDANEWRPGYIQSTDAGGFIGGMAFVVNGAGVGNKFAEVETMRIQNGRVGIGNSAPSTLLQVGNATCNGTTWINASDRNIKENFKQVDARAVLEKVAALPIQSWSYTNDVTTRHLGPMAQDFYAAFGTGTDERHIATVDADGVALAAIQGLNQKLEAEVKSKDDRIAELEKRLAVIEALLQK